jgi:hypothetical protein
MTETFSMNNPFSKETTTKKVPRFFVSGPKVQQMSPNVFSSKNDKGHIQITTEKKNVMVTMMIVLADWS